MLDSMGFAGYVAVCVQLYCRCFTVFHLVVTVLHYMAIFRCVEYFYFHIPEGIIFRNMKVKILPSFRNMKVKISYTPEDGDVV
jgi:hypothetical protein